MDNGTAAWGQTSDAGGWGDHDEPSKTPGWGNPSPNPVKPGKNTDSQMTTLQDLNSEFTSSFQGVVLSLKEDNIINLSVRMEFSIFQSRAFKFIATMFCCCCRHQVNGKLGWERRRIRVGLPSPQLG